MEHHCVVYSVFDVFESVNSEDTREGLSFFGVALFLSMNSILIDWVWCSGELKGGYKEEMGLKEREAFLYV